MSSVSMLYQRQSRVLEFGFAVFCVLMAGYNLFFSTPYYVFLSLLGLLLIFVPRIAEKVLSLKEDYLLRLTTHLYILFTYGIGMIFNGYDRIPLYDKLMHTVTGVIFGLCGLVVYYLLKPREEKMRVKRAEFWQAAVFSAGFASLIAVGWEIVEFVINLVLHNDPQHVLDTGVTDTMMDMIVCLIGSLVFWYPMRRYYKQGKTGLLMGVFDSFYRTNFHVETVLEEKEK